jgi:hypothetical protein
VGERPGEREAVFRDSPEPVSPTSFPFAPPAPEAWRGFLDARPRGSQSRRRVGRATALDREVTRREGEPPWLTK